MARTRDKCGDKKGYTPPRRQTTPLAPAVSQFRQNDLCNSVARAARYSSHTAHGIGIGSGTLQRADTAAAYSDGWRDYRPNKASRFVPKK